MERKEQFFLRRRNIKPRAQQTNHHCCCNSSRRIWLHSRRTTPTGGRCGFEQQLCVAILINCPLLQSSSKPQFASFHVHRVSLQLSCEFSTLLLQLSSPSTHDAFNPFSSNISRAAHNRANVHVSLWKRESLSTSHDSGGLRLIVVRFAIFGCYHWRVSTNQSECDLCYVVWLHQLYKFVLVSIGILRITTDHGLRYNKKARNYIEVRSPRCCRSS